MNNINIKISDIKNIDIAIKGIEYYEFKKSFSIKVHNEYKDDKDFKIGYDMAKKLNSKKRLKKSICKQI